VRAGAFLTLRGEKDLDWTFISPSAELAPGERTGRFRLGSDALLVDAEGKSRISMEDFAIALIEELKRPGQQPAELHSLTSRRASAPSARLKPRALKSFYSSAAASGTTSSARKTDIVDRANDNRVQRTS
jgi:hypothetical protein